MISTICYSMIKVKLRTGKVEKLCHVCLIPDKNIEQNETIRCLPLRRVNSQVCRFDVIRTIRSQVKLGLPDCRFQDDGGFCSAASTVRWWSSVCCLVQYGRRSAFCFLVPCLIGEARRGAGYPKSLGQNSSHFAQSARLTSCCYKHTASEMLFLGERTQKFFGEGLVFQCLSDNAQT